MCIKYKDPEVKHFSDGIYNIGVTVSQIVSCLEDEKRSFRPHALGTCML